MSMNPTGLAFRTEIRPGYVFVWQGGKVQVPEELANLQQSIKSALDEAGTRTAMFDNRDTASPDEWIRASMWTWLSENVERAALLQEVPKNIRRAERAGERNRVTVRAFHDEAEAEAWLLRRAS